MKVLEAIITKKKDDKFVKDMKDVKSKNFVR